MEEHGRQHVSWKQIVDFIIHLRWHYQLFILSGGFLLGGYLSDGMLWTPFLMQFLNVHLLLFGGATAYNSYWDKDEGPVGGLKNPPEMQRWMWAASLVLQFAGLGLALLGGWRFVIIYASSLLFFWLYSTPHFRWKGRPLLSLVAIGISTGSNSLLLGFLAAANEPLTGTVFIAALGVMLVVLSLYPVSQLFQLDEDSRRGDQTFAITFGAPGVMQFFLVAFNGGVVLIALGVAATAFWDGLSFFILGSLAGYGVLRQLRQLVCQPDSYDQVMRIKYLTSLSFAGLIVLLIIF